MPGVHGSRALGLPRSSRRASEGARALAERLDVVSLERSAAGTALVVHLLPRHLTHALVGLIVLAVAAAGLTGGRSGDDVGLRGWVFDPFVPGGAPSYLTTHPFLGPGLSERTTIVEYVVQPGDTVSQIANRLGVSTETVIWANEIRDPNLIRPGDVLRVPPITGVLHTVEPGDTLAQLASRYGASVEAVLAYPLNRIENPEELIAGQLIMFPFGVRPRPSAPTSAGVAAGAATTGPATGEAAAAAAAALRGFRLGWPTEGRITQYYSGYHQALDIAAPLGNGVFAIDAGTVIVAATGWNGGYGTVIDIDHGNGFVSRYAHLNRMSVGKGDWVARGQPIGTIGLTGITTGPHVHFELLFRGVRVNPLTYLR
jgi:murein DD-endopeptidase MepM/ murein hydrolase activator NlpD